MEAPICRLDALFREVSCLAGGQIRDVATSLNSIVEPSDYYPFLLFHVGTNGVTTKSLRSTKKGLQSPEKNTKKFWSTGSNFLNHPGNGGRLRMKQASQDINTWLQDYGLQQNFEFLNHGRALERQGIGPNGMHLP